MSTPEATLAAMSEAVLGIAGRAPSLHNSQPWRFRVGATSIELLLDRSRLLPAIDPTGRESVLSCGAALYSLRLAIAGVGFEPEVRLLPDPVDPTHLATVSLGHGRSARRDEQDMLAAVPRRHTHRQAFLPQDVDRGLLVRLQEAAAGEGATLHLVEQPGARTSIGRLLVTADREQRADPAYRAELAAWTPEPGSIRRDGVPASAYLTSPAGAVPAEFPGRDFSLGRGHGVSPDDTQVGIEGPAVAVLTTAGDRTIDWLRAGQALQHVLLLASVDSVYAWFATAPYRIAGVSGSSPRAESAVEVPRTLLTEEAATGPLRVGHPPGGRGVSLG